MKARHAVPGSPDSLQKSSAQPKDHLATNLYPRPNTQSCKCALPSTILRFGNRPRHPMRCSDKFGNAKCLNRQAR